MFHFDSIRKRFMQLWSYDFTRLLIVSIAAHSNSISVGLTQGYSAVLLPQLTSPNSTLNITTEEASWIASLPAITAPFGSLFSGVIVDLLGRKLAIISTSVPFLIGWILMTLANDPNYLYFGRAITGFATGINAPSFLYIAEVSTKEHRSFLSALGSVFVSLGILIVYTLGFLTTWQKAAFIGAIFSALIVLSLFRAPETPSWLVSRDQIGEAKKAIHWFRSDPVSADMELATLVVNKMEADQEAKLNFKEEESNFLKRILMKIKSHATAIMLPTVYKPFLILFFFFLFQSGSGLYIFLYYITHIFKQFGTYYDENLIAVTMGVFRLIMSIIGSLLMAKIGRRPLALFSGTCMAFSLLFVSVHQFICDKRSQSYDLLPLICIMLYFGFTTTGFLQLPWIMASEMFQMEHRGIFTGIMSCLGYMFVFAGVKIYPDLLRTLGLQGMMWGFFVMTSIGTLFIYFFLPETKGKTLKEISMGFITRKSIDEERGKADIKEVYKKISRMGRETNFPPTDNETESAAVK